MSRQENYGITAANVKPHSIRSSRQPIDYVSLNDGYEDETPSPSKKRRKESHRPKSAPSATRLSAHKCMNSPESTALDVDTPTPDTFTAIPTPSTSTLEGTPNVDEQLPDLVLPPSGNVPENKLLVNVGNTEEDLEAASALLSLGDTLEDTTDEGDENALLMPVGGANVPEDVAPQPLWLDQISVDNAIAGLVATEQQEEDTANNKNEESVPTDSLAIKQDQTDANPVKKGTLETKTYILKKKPEKRHTFKCSECKFVQLSIQKLNEHHRCAHNPQMCGICNRTFALASSLTRHMYDHEEKIFNCDMCNYSSHFESELETHKIVHRKQPSHQCMHANCGKWFRRKWDLTLHLQKHDRTELTCDYAGCKFKTATKKQLK